MSDSTVRLLTCGGLALFLSGEPSIGSVLLNAELFLESGLESTRREPVLLRLGTKIADFISRCVKKINKYQHLTRK